MIKWDNILGAEEYKIVIDGYSPITTLYPQVNISHIDRNIKREGYIIAVSKLCVSEKSFFVLEKGIEEPKVQIVIDNNRVLSTLIQMKGTHKIFYGMNIESLNIQKEFKDEIRILSNEFPRFYFQINGKIYYNLSFLPKPCIMPTKTTYKLDYNENRTCSKEYFFSSTRKAWGYVLYIPNTFISKIISSTFVVGSGNSCKYDYEEGYIYPYYLNDQGTLCDYGEAIKINLTPF